MRNILTGFIVAVLLTQVLVISTASPAVAITADLAKKCREMAIKAHPPTQAGSTPYAAAERDYFRECISKNGNMPDNKAEKSSLPGDHP
jgi:hypothetical protein